MPQSPFLTDAVKIEPGSPGSRVIDRDPDTGSIRFIDPTLPGGSVNLPDLAGTSSVAGVYIVAPEGPGADFNSISEAVDAIPEGTLGHYVVFVYPGHYEDNVVLDKDRVSIIGVGDPTVSADTNDHTITIQNGTHSVSRVYIRGLRLMNQFPDRACVAVIGDIGETLGEDEITVAECGLAALSTDGYPLMAIGVHHLQVQGGSMSGSTSTSTTLIGDCGKVRLNQIDVITRLWMYFDPGSGPYYSTGPYSVSPANPDYRVSRSTSIGDTEISVTHSSGVVSFGSCTDVGNVIVSGQTPVHFEFCKVESIAIDVPSTVVLRKVARGPATGIGTLDETKKSGSTDFFNESTKTIMFDVPLPDDNYMIVLDTESEVRPVAVSRTFSGFTIQFPSPQTTRVNWSLLR